MKYGVLIAEADRDEAQAVKTALQKAGLDAPVHWINKGDEVIEYLEDSSHEHQLTSILLLDAKPSERQRF